MATIPTCFEDLDWSESAKPTSAHFLALIMAYRERASLQDPNAFPALDVANLTSTQSYNAISFGEIRYFISELHLHLDLLRSVNRSAMEDRNHNLDGEAYLTNTIGAPYWQKTDTDFYIEAELSKRITNIDASYVHMRAMIAKLDELIVAHRYKEINSRALMKLLIRHKNFVGKLTELYCQIGSLGFSRPQYFIDWSTNIDSDKPNSFLDAQERTNSANTSNIEAWWYYDKGENGNNWESEKLYFECNDCDIPYIFKYPAIVSVHCWEERTSNYEDDDSWYYDFGTGLNLGWNNLGTHNFGERIPLLPKQGWGDAKATAVPPKRDTVGNFACSWGVDFIKFDFRDSLKFKVLSNNA